MRGRRYYTDRPREEWRTGQIFSLIPLITISLAVAVLHPGLYRFVSAGTVEDTDDKAKSGLSSDPEEMAKSSKRKAADMKMFGKLTREQVAVI